MEIRFIYVLVEPLYIVTRTMEYWYIMKHVGSFNVK